MVIIMTDRKDEPRLLSTTTRERYLEETGGTDRRRSQPKITEAPMIMITSVIFKRGEKGVVSERREVQQNREGGENILHKADSSQPPRRESGGKKAAKER